jgi:D-glycero-D-manno-heptose 1,7-bisphosphate phosphatase
VKLLIFDRDGVLNQHTVDPEHGTIDSPLHPSQVRMVPEAASVLSRLTALGYAISIASNQPAAAKGKTTRANLEAVHEAVVRELTRAGARIDSSHICFHRAEDGCDCRKPKPGLLLQALERHPEARREDTWMVGDGVTDAAAGQALGLKTAFIGQRRCDACRLLLGPPPTFWGSLAQFAERLAQNGR